MQTVHTLSHDGRLGRDALESITTLRIYARDRLRRDDVEAYAADVESFAREVLAEFLVARAEVAEMRARKIDHDFEAGHGQVRRGPAR